MYRFLPLIILCCSGCTHMAQDEWTGRDKAQHFISSAFLAAAGNAYGERQNWSEGHSATFGLTFAISRRGKRAVRQSGRWNRMELEGFYLGFSRCCHRLYIVEPRSLATA